MGTVTEIDRLGKKMQSHQYLVNSFPKVEGRTVTFDGVYWTGSRPKQDAKDPRDTIEMTLGRCASADVAAKRANAVKTEAISKLLKLGIENRRRLANDALIKRFIRESERCIRSP